jgi:hypothetical protein
MLLFASTILLSAFLLFLVQPVIAKQILPWFGGTSAVWTTCMVFFQVLLLAGYAYAHASTRYLTPRRQAQLHIALLVVSLAFLPIIPSVALKPAGEEDAALRILLLLGATIGLPYFLLSTTGPLVQKWVAHRFPENTVYRLFALSNFGSLVGLLAFPFAIEPFSTSRAQSLVWSGAYALFVIACTATAWQSRTRPLAVERQEDISAPAPGAGAYLAWLALSTLGSVMLLAATSHITQNIASVPFLWVVPLTLYLLTFVLAFEGRGGRGWYERNWLVLPTLMLLVAMTAGLSASRGVLDVGLAVPLYCVGMFFACLFCHGELAQQKPAPRYLTQFYLTLSAGGALGGLFVGLIAPRIFPTYYELPLALFALAAVSVWLVARSKALIGPALIATAATAYYGLHYADFLKDDIIVMERNFYGTLRVRQTGVGEAEVRRLLHGVILHGEQLTTSSRRNEPGTYYARSSGVGEAIATRQALGPVRIGVVGLGVGTLSAYGRAGDTLRFYELDPDVLSLARREFGYLNATPARLEFAMGDARLSLERELAQGTPGRFDVLAIDAFSSDSIPVHLITREAVALYLQHVKPDGMVAIHISNRFLDLKPVLGNISHALGAHARLVSDPGDALVSSTDWVLIARSPSAFVGALAARSEPLPQRPRLSVWTDQFNNLLEVLKTSPLDDLKGLFSQS